MIFFLSFLFILLLHPAVSRLKNAHVPTVFAVLLPIVLFLVLLGLVGFYLLPAFVKQIIQFVNHVPIYLRQLQQLSYLKQHHIKLTTSSVGKFIETHSTTFTNALTTVVSLTVRLVTGLLTVIIVTIYGVSNYDRIKTVLLTYFPANGRKRAEDIWSRLERKIITWVGAQLFLSVTVGVMVWIGSLLIGLPFPAVLGLIAGFLELVPTLGPILATVPGFLLGLTISTKVALLAILVHVIIAQIEEHILAPLLLGKTVRLHPIIIIFSLLVGAVLYGLLGTLLAVPSALVISSFVDSYRNEPLNQTLTGRLRAMRHSH